MRVMKHSIVPLHGPHQVKMHRYARVLSARARGDRIELWVECDPLHTVLERLFNVVFTDAGQVGKNGTYIATMLFNESDPEPLEVHLYDHGELPLVCPSFDIATERRP